jgi:hypothetical protein
MMLEVLIIIKGIEASVRSVQSKRDYNRHLAQVGSAGTLARLERASTEETLKFKLNESGRLAACWSARFEPGVFNDRG